MKFDLIGIVSVLLITVMLILSLSVVILQLPWIFYSVWSLIIVVMATVLIAMLGMCLVALLDG